MVAPEWDSIQCFNFFWISGYSREVLRQLHCPQSHYIQRQCCPWLSTLFHCLCVKSKCGIQQHHGEPFLHFMHDMVMLNNRNKYLGSSVSFMVDFYFYILAVALIPNNVIHSINYNIDLLHKILKETFEMEISQFTKSVGQWHHQFGSSCVTLLLPQGRPSRLWNVPVQYVYEVWIRNLWELQERGHAIQELGHHP